MSSAMCTLFDRTMHGQSENERQHHAVLPFRSAWLLMVNTSSLGLVLRLRCTVSLYVVLGAGVTSFVYLLGVCFLSTSPFLTLGSQHKTVQSISDRSCMLELSQVRAESRCFQGSTSVALFSPRYRCNPLKLPAIDSS